MPEEALRTELRKLGTRAPEIEPHSMSPFFAPEMRETLLFGIMLTYQEQGNKNEALVKDVFVSEYGEERLRTLEAGSDGEKEAAQMLASENFFELHQNRDEALDALIHERPLESNRIKAAYEVLSKALKKAEVEKNEREIERLMGELRELSKKLE